MNNNRGRVHNKNGGSECMEKNQKIKCNVESCKFQDCDCCTLDEIQVGCNCGCKEAIKNKETLCRSFECSKEKTETE